MFLFTIRLFIMTRYTREHFVNESNSAHRDVNHRFSEYLEHDGAAGERSGSLAAPAGNQANRGMNNTHHSITTLFR